VPLVDLLYGQNEMHGLARTPDTLHLGCSYHLHSSHHFLSTRGAVIKKKGTASAIPGLSPNPNPNP